jgi:hypothetical protein
MQAKIKALPSSSISMSYATSCGVRPSRAAIALMESSRAGV